jgi:hypothetical protein
LALAFLGSSAKQNNKPFAVSPEVDTLKRRCYFCRGLNVQGSKPLREWAATGKIDVFPNVEEYLIVTYTLALEAPTSA